MTIKLPHPTDRYFAAQNAHDVDAMVACFAPDAKVHDEGKDHVGWDAIRGWKIEAVVKLGVSVAPFDVRKDSGQTIVKSTVSGNFAGSPVDLTFFFGLSDGLIETLEIRP